MVDFNTLKSHVNSSWVNDSEVLRLGSKQKGQAEADLKIGSSFGRVVNWLLPSAITGNHHFTPSDRAALEADPLLKVDHHDVKTRVLAALMGKFDDHVINQLSQVLDWSSSKPLTAREVRFVIQTAEHLQNIETTTPTTSNAHTGHYSAGNLLGAMKRLGAGMVNVVSTGTFMQRSQDRQMVFKPVGEKAPANFPAIGIQTRENLLVVPLSSDISHNGNVSGRNIASAELAHALGMSEMIAQTLHTHLDSVEGIMMTKAEGNSVLATGGKLNFNTSCHLENIAKKIPAWNEQLMFFNLVITGHTGNQVHLEKRNLSRETASAVVLTSQYMQKLTPQQIQGITLESNGNLTHSGNADRRVLDLINREHFMNTLKTTAITMLPVDSEGLINDRKLNCDLNRLQWLDFICAQGDRNGSNLFIQYNAGGQMTGLTGIDNDASFGEFVDHNGVYLNDNPSTIQRGLAYQGMPKNAIDEETAGKIKALHADQNKFQEMLSNNKLTAAEISAATKRLDTAYHQIMQWESTEYPELHIIPRDSLAWKNQNRQGYSKMFASVFRAIHSPSQVSPSRLASILQ